MSNYDGYSVDDMSWVDSAMDNLQPRDERGAERTVQYISKQQIMTMQRLRQQLGLPLMNKRKLYSITAEVAYQLISDYIKLANGGR